MQVNTRVRCEGVCVCVLVWMLLNLAYKKAYKKKSGTISIEQEKQLVYEEWSESNQVVRPYVILSALYNVQYLS